MKKNTSDTITTFLDILGSEGPQHFCRIFTCCGAADLTQAKYIAGILSRENIIELDNETGICSLMPDYRDRLTSRSLCSLSLEVNERCKIKCPSPDYNSPQVRMVFDPYHTENFDLQITDMIIDFIKTLEDHQGYQHVDKISAGCGISNEEGRVIARLLADDGLIRFNENTRYCYAMRSMKDISFYEAMYAGVKRYQDEFPNPQDEYYKSLNLNTYLAFRATITVSLEKNTEKTN